MAKYEIQSDGRITDEGQSIGWVEGGQTLVFNEGVEVSPQARNYLQKVLEGKGEEGSPPEEQESQPQGEVPPAPEQDPAMGDKTPAYVEWRQKYFPKEFEKEYRGRRTHLTTGINPHLQGQGDVPEGQFGADPKEERLK